MAVSTSYAPLAYAWTTTNQTFPVTWPFFSGTLNVIHAQGGNEGVLTLGSDYTVSGGTDAEGLPAVGSITMIGAAQGGTIRIERNTPKTQAVAWVENDPFPAKVMEATLDRLVLIAQETLTRFNWEGAWTESIDYTVADVVSNANASYICIADHTSDATTEPGVGASWQTNWSLIAAGGQDGSNPVWHTASGAPSSGLGSNGDLYLNTNNGDVYGPKANGSWGSPVANLTGPSGSGTGDMLKSENLAGLTNAALARSNLGLAIGINVQAFSAILSAIAGLTLSANKGIYFSGATTATTFDLTAAGRALLDDADAAAQRATLGLGSAATANSGDFAPAGHDHSASDITSGTIATARLGSGTASSSTYLRGDQTWASISAGNVQDVRLGTEASSAIHAETKKAPMGSVLTGLKNDFTAPESSITVVRTLYHRPLQKQVGGSWVTVSQV